MMNGQCLAERRESVDPTNKDLINPFVHHLELTTTYEKIKAGILTVVVLPARLLVIACLLVLAWLLACIGLWGLSEKDLQERPLARWRRTVRRVSYLVVRALLFAFGFHWVGVKGVKASRFQAPLIVMSPHSTFFDILPAICMGDICVLTAKENLNIPIIGKLINFTQPVYVWRDDPDSRQKTIQQIIERATSELEWSQMLIFPEGTCTNRSCLITFKPGAFYPGVPVQPVILRYPNKLDTVTWTWQGPGVLKLMWLTLVQPHSNCEIEFLPVYKPSAAEKADPKLYAENVRQLMAQALGVPTMDYTYDDCQLVARANELRIPRSCLALRILKMRIRLGLTRSRREEKLVAANRDQLHSAQPVDLTQFAERLAIPVSDPVLQEMFTLLDSDGSGHVDLSEYLTCVLMVDCSSSRHEMLDMAFELYGRSERCVSREQAASLLRLIFHLSLNDAHKFAKDIPAASDGCISLVQFESFMKKRPDLLALSDNNNGGHVKED